MSFWLFQTKMWTPIWHALIQMIYEERYDSWIVFYSVCLCCTHLEEAPVRPIIGGMTEKPVTRIYMTNEGRDGAAKHQQMNLKNAHMRARNSLQHQTAVLTSKLCRENLFVAANEGTDLRTSWLIIYPAGFMALINFPPLSLYLPLKVWSQPASGADNAGVSAASQPPL